MTFATTALTRGLAATTFSLIMWGCTPTVTLRSAEDRADTVQVAAPTGERHFDRASILAALDRVRPGGTILFAPGTYLVGELIVIETPRITMQGHLEGTTLRACEPDEYQRMELAVASSFE
jgi:hypothetical protein